MKQIIINGKFLTQRITGVQRYAREIVRELDELVSQDEIVLAVPKRTENIPLYKNIKVIEVGNGRGIYWEQIEFPIFVKKRGGVSLNLCNVAPLLAPDIVCIFDMKIRSHPQFFSFKFKLWYNLLFLNQTIRAKFILTDSETAKNEILAYYPKVQSHKIKVIYPSWQHYDRVEYDENTLKKYCVERKKYFFAMGSMDPNKNFRWIADVARKNPREMFAVAGSINEKVFNQGLGFECPDNMTLLGYVSDEEAKTLMREAKAFLFPSFCEGFGIPPLEALSAGCQRLIVSDIPVMHEVFGNRACYIDPYVPELYTNQVNAKSQMSSKEILDKYSWKNSARQLLELIKYFTN